MGRRLLEAGWGALPLRERRTSHSGIGRGHRVGSTREAVARVSPSVLSFLALGVAIVLLAGPLAQNAAAANSTDYILGHPGRDDDYGISGKVYRYAWPAYNLSGDPRHNVSSFYVTDPEYLANYGIEWFVETGFDNQAFTYANGGSNVDAFYAYSDMATGAYKGPYYVSTSTASSTWYPFKIQNTTRVGPLQATWELYYNGVKKATIKSSNLYQGRAEAASERWNVANARSSFDVMKYMSSSGSWINWPGVTFIDKSGAYAPFKVSNTAFYMYKL